MVTTIFAVLFRSIEVVDGDLVAGISLVFQALFRGVFECFQSLPLHWILLVELGRPVSSFEGS